MCLCHLIAALVMILLLIGWQTQLFLVEGDSPWESQRRRKGADGLNVITPFEPGVRAGNLPASLN